MLVSLLLLALGLVLMTGGADFFVRGAALLARVLGLSPLVIGLTIVAFGTSAPEVGVSVSAALAGESGMAVGNVIGSNSFNTLLILGVSALIVPLSVQRQLVRLDVPIMIVVTALVWGMAASGAISRVESSILLLLLVAWIVLTVRTGRADAEEAEEILERPFTPLRDVPALVLGLGALVLGAKLSVDGALGVARGLGVSEVIIGITLVAAGTSLPELVTSVVAAMRGQRDIAVGNIVGSNLFNLLCVLGVSGVVGDGLVVEPGLVTRDFPVVFITAMVCLPFFITGEEICRSEGLLLVAGYVLYMTEVVLEQLYPAWQDPMRAGILYAFLPTVALVTLLNVFVHLRNRRRKGSGIP